MKASEIIIRGIIAGLLISLGCISFLVSDDKFIGSVLFSIGLLSIIHFKQKLFTGVLCNCSIYKDSALEYLNMVSELLNSFFGNFIGVLLGSSFLKLSRLNYLIPKIDDIVSKKATDSPVSLIILGILCEACIFIAVKSKKELFTIFGVTVFVFCGFEHCIADLFYYCSTSLNISFSLILYVILGNVFGGVILSSVYDYLTSNI